MPKHKKITSKYIPRARWGTSLKSALPLSVLAGIVLIAVAAFLAYYPSISGGFILDDDLYVTNSRIIKAQDGVYRFWCTAEPYDYWPLANTTFWIEWRLWGMNPTGYHITNLILHIVDALLIWIILRKLSIPGAFLAAMIFTVHPVNVESVAWISQLKNVMSVLFFLLSILCYLKHLLPSISDDIYSSRHTTCADSAHGVCGPHSGADPAHGVWGLLTGGWYWLSLAAFVMAMLSKGSVIILPVLILGIIWWLRSLGTVPISDSTKMGRSPSIRSDLLRTAPFFVLAAVLAVVNMWFQTHGTGEVVRNAGFTERLLGAGGVVWFYLYKALLPFDLAFIYPQWNIETGNPLWWLPLSAVLIVTAVLWRYRSTWSRPFLFAWVFFCVALVPVMGIIDVGFMKYSLVADRYQHIAVIGVIALVSAGWSGWHRLTRIGARWTTAVAVLMVAAFTFLTCQQNGIYRDAISLYKAALAKNPNCLIAYYNLGVALYDTGKVPEAIESYRQALAIKPDYVNAQINLGGALLDLGKAQEAIVHFEQALRIDNDIPVTHNNLGLALLKTGRTQEAIEHHKQAIKLDPKYADARNNLGYALYKSGRFQEAIEYYRQALDLTPDYLKAHNNLGVALVRMGRFQEGIEHFEQVLRFNSRDFEAHNNLGSVLLDVGRVQEAIDHCRQALRLKPDDPEAHYNLGNALVKTGSLKEAIEHYGQALQFKPDYPEAHNNLGGALIQAGRVPEAIEHLKLAVRLTPKDVNAWNNLALVYVMTRQSAEAVAAARKAMELARSQGQTAQAKQIEDWLNSYRASLSDSPK